MRPDLEEAATVGPGDGAAAGTQGNDVEAGKGDALGRDGPVHGQGRLAIDDHRDVARRPAHVEGDEVGGIEELRHPAGTGEAARGPAQDRAGGDADRFLDRRHATMGLHDEHRPAVADFGQARLEAGQIAVHERPDIGVHDGGRGALVFLDLGQHFAREGHVGVGHGLRERRTRRPLVPVDILERMKLAGEGAGLFMLDQELGQRVFTPPPEEA